MTALRVIPPSSAAIWLADRPSAHNFFRSSTLSSVQPIGFFSSDFNALDRIQPHRQTPPFGARRSTRQEWTRNRLVARYVVLAGNKATIGCDSLASSAAGYQQVFP